MEEHKEEEKIEEKEQKEDIKEEKIEGKAEEEKKEVEEKPIKEKCHLKISLVSQNTKKTAPQQGHPSKRSGHSVIFNYQGMVIFAGRQNTRVTSSISTLDIQTLTWTKVEQLGICPPAREHHIAAEVRLLN